MTSADQGPLSFGGPGLSRRAKIALPIVLLALAALTWHRYAQVPARPVIAFQGAALGTTWSVKIATDALAASEARTREVIEERIARIDGLMSTWKAESELSRFNRSASSAPFPVAAETLAVFEIAQTVSAASRGAFDVTVGPLVDAWGFGAPGTPARPPSTEALAALSEHVGYAKLEVDAAAGALAKRDPALVCDLSAVAKGYVVDEIARGLIALGEADFLVEVGGELGARGAHRDGSPWRVAIEAPDEGGRRVHRIVALRDLSMATSGDYRNYYEVEGRRISHTIDPRTASPITHRLASVTVLHPEAAWADAWATALNVLGPDDGYALADAEELAAYFIERRDDGSFAPRWTAAFDPHLEE